MPWMAIPLLILGLLGITGLALASSQTDTGSGLPARGPDPPPQLVPGEPLYPPAQNLNLAFPDWYFEEFAMFPAGLSEGAFPNLYSTGGITDNWAHPGLDVYITLGNMGDPLNQNETDFANSSVLAQTLDGTTLFTGTALRFVPFSQLNDGNLACGPTILVARVPDGLLRDLNPQNNWAIAAVEPIGSFDRDLRHMQDPVVSYEGPGSNYSGVNVFGPGTITCENCENMEFLPAEEPYLRIEPRTEALGSCPPLPTLSFIDSTETYHLWMQAYLNNNYIGGVGPLPPWVAPAIELPDRLYDNDVVCVQVWIDPPHGWGPSGWVLETNESNNMAVIVMQWTQHWWNGNSFNTVFNEPSFSGAGCSAIEVGVTDNATVVIVNVVSGALSLGLVSLALGRTLLPGLFAGGASKAGLVVIALVAAAIGGIGGSLIPGPAEASLQTRSGGAGIDALSCDRYLDPKSARPGEMAAVDSSQITLSLSPSTDAPQPAPEDYLLKIVAPSGRESFLPAWDGLQGDKPDGYSIAAFDLANALAAVSGTDTLERGPYQWSVVQGQVGAGGDLQPYSTVCRGSMTHTFLLPDEPAEPPDGEEPITPTFTPSPTPTVGIVVTTVPPTATSTPPPPPTATSAPADTSGPKASGANASPNPTLTTEPVTISATVSDPSGVASVILYYRTGKNAYTSVPMKAGGGNGYSVTIGPLTPAGSYDFRIYAVDGLGNSNCDQGNVGSCPGGSFQVNIP